MSQLDNSSRGTNALDLQGAEKAIRQGSDLGFFVALLWLTVVILSIATDYGGVLDQWNDPWMLIDGLLLAGLAFGVRRRSRTCAISLTAYYVFSVIFKSVTTGRAPCIVVPAILVYFFARAIHATFVYHKLRAIQDPEYRAVPRRAYWFLIPGAAAVVLLLSFAVIGEFMVPTVVIEGAEMKPRCTALLRERGLLHENEQVVMFYSTAFFSILRDGNMLTDHRVVSYETIDDKLTVYQATYDDIVEVEVLSVGNFFEDTMIGIVTTSNEGFVLFASTEAGGDKRLLAGIESRIGQTEAVSPPVRGP